MLSHVHPGTSKIMVLLASFLLESATTALVTHLSLFLLHGRDIHLVHCYTQTALLWAIRGFSACMALRMCAGVALAQMSWQWFDVMGCSGPSSAASQARSSAARSPPPPALAPPLGRNQSAVV
jgi:hypothetical protein